MPASGQSSVSVTSTLDPFASIVAIIVVDTTTNTGANWGTGFLVSSDGLLLTDSHVAWRATHDPARYRLLVIAGGEFYAGTVICATPLTDYTPGSDTLVQRDLAAVKLSPSDFPFSEWTFERGNSALTFHAHTGSLSGFPTLALAEHGPAQGAAIHTRGWGGNPVGPLVEYGSVAYLSHAQDGTPMFAIKETAPSAHGMSGGPVLDQQERVVGIFWGGGSNAARVMWGIDVGELRHPCGSVNL